MEKKGYFAVIPAIVRYDSELNANAKLLYGELTALSNEKGYCWATNQYFADLYSVSKRTISTWISNLEEREYIKTRLNYKENSKEVANRFIYILPYPVENEFYTPRKNLHEGIEESTQGGSEENFQDNTTPINNTNNKVKKTRKQVYEDSSDYMKLAKMLYEKILLNNEIDPPVFQNWANDIRLMIEKDKRSIDDVMRMIAFSQKDKFWQNNILSPAKLRKQFITLKAQAKSKSESKTSNAFSGVDLNG